MGFLSNLFHRKQSVADYDKLVSKHKINQYQGESYIHWFVLSILHKME